MDSRIKGRPERERINIDEEFDVKEWAKKMGITPDELRDAVNKVGTRATDVEAYIKTQRRK